MRQPQVLQIGLAQGRRQEQSKSGAKQRADALARELPACNEAAPARHVLDQEGGRAAELAAGGKALNQARDDDEQRRQHADLVEGRHATDRERADGHHRNRKQQRRLAAVAVGVGTEQDAADRPRQEGQGKVPKVSSREVVGSPVGKNAFDR